MIKRLFCSHDWKVLDKSLHASRLEVAKRYTPAGTTIDEFTKGTDLWYLCKETQVLVLSCNKCGTTKTIKNHN